ncbi:MAG: alpha/beta fold hydrolase, partial [Desulfuromonadaceae bacterium]|nr:alpha/beta fold hydrolase [Desulfuromonadaceae bacterium]
NLISGVESIRFYSEEELLASGFPREVIRDSHFVPAYGQLDGVELFDASFFNMTPREAELCDPQQRHLLEIAWETLESAGCDPETFDGRIGVFVGVGSNAYLEENLIPALGESDVATGFQISIMNGKEFVATRISYKLNLDGPSLNVNTTCSTSLVAVHLAARAVLDGQCEMALAGGAKIQTGGATGYLYREGFILSPDGHCRAFDQAAGGTVGGSGAGLVALKRLSAAVAEGDPILAVIKGSAVNNDGADKVGFTAPSVRGQTEVIRQAHRSANVPPETISYLEAHGTGTSLGDPIEIRALTEAFGDEVEKRSCAIGSVKTNIGHLDAASGIAGLIKTIKALEYGQIPPLLHFTAPNPAIDFANSPFFAAERLIPWKKGRTPRRAGVSSFGIGGTNAHVILEEAPLLDSGPSHRPHRLLLLSAQGESALDRMAHNLAAWLERYPETDLDNLAFTLAVGRKKFGVRRALACRDLQETINLLRSEKFFKAAVREEHPEVVFLFTGQGSQYAGMGRPLYLHEPVFRDTFDRCAAILKPHIGLDLRHLLWPEIVDGQAPGDLAATRYAQPAIFALEYSLATLWMTWGVKPKAMIGHSLGEWAAACLAGVFTLEDALHLVALRGRLMDEQESGGMLAVSLTQTETEMLLRDGLCLAAVNARNQCVISGPHPALDRLEDELQAAGRQVKRLDTSHAFHSRMMEPAVPPFLEALLRTEMRTPSIPFVSNLTGTWILDEQATSPDYWAKQIRKPVLFHQGLEALLQNSSAALLEIGPDAVLSHLAARHPALLPNLPVISTLRTGREKSAVNNHRSLMEAVGNLWAIGVEIEWKAFYAHEKRRRIVLPTYPFDRKRHWIDPPRHAVPAAVPSPTLTQPPLSEPAGPHATLAANGTTNGAPINATERIIIAAMMEILGLKEISREEDFFRIGGDSLTAVQLAAKLEKELRVAIPRHALLEGATAARLAAWVAVPSAGREDSFPQPGLIQLAAGQAGHPPLILVPAIGGGAFIYRELAAALSIPNPILALEAPGLWDDTPPLNSVEKLAAHFLGLVGKVQDRPPLLVGSSFGGLVAFEMTRQLAETGSPPLGTILIDSPGPGHLPRPLQGDDEILAYLLSGDDPDGRFEDHLERLRRIPAEQRLEFAARHLGQEAVEGTLQVEEMFRILAVYKANIEAMFGYLPQPCSSRIVFLKAREANAFTAPHPELAWVPLAEGGIEIIPIPGSHATMLNPPHVETLAAELARFCKQIPAAWK